MASVDDRGADSGSDGGRGDAGNRPSALRPGDDSSAYSGQDGRGSRRDSEREGRNAERGDLDMTVGSTLSLKQLADGADDAEAQALRETIAAQARDASPSPDSLASDDEARHARSRRGARARGHEDSHSDAGSSHGGDARWARRRGPRKGAGDGFNDAVSSPRSPRSPRHGLNMSGYTVPGRDSPRRRRMLRIPAEPTQAEQVWVSVRLRPEQPVDRDTGRVSVIAPSRCVYVQPSKRRRTEKRFFFSSVFGATATQADVFRGTAAHAVEDVLRGINSCVLCYGQTGAGKTYTTFGPDIDCARITATAASLLGLIPRAMHQLFESIEQRSSDFDFEVSVSYLQLYMDHVYDLLKPKSGSLALRQGSDNVAYVQGLSSHVTTDVHEVLALMEIGARSKVVAANTLNARSSRSHTLFTVTVKRTIRDALLDDTPFSPEADAGTLARVLSARLTFVDLAGSERTSRTKSDGLALEEAKDINRSLAALGNVVSALSKRSRPGRKSRKTFIPWRDSKLTRLLQDTLGANAKLRVIINISPSNASASETFSSLLFGQRALTVTVAPTVNESTDYKSMCTVLQRQLDELLDRQRQQNSVMVARYEELKLRNEDLQRKLDDVEARYEKAQEQAEEAQVEAALGRRQITALEERLQSAERLVASSKELAGAVGASREALLEEALLEQVAVSERLTRELKMATDLDATTRITDLEREKAELQSEVDRLSESLASMLEVGFQYPELAARLAQAGGAALLDPPVTAATKRLAVVAANSPNGTNGSAFQSPSRGAPSTPRPREDASVIYALQASNAALREEVLRLRRGTPRASEMEKALSRQADMLEEAGRRAAASKAADTVVMDGAQQKVEELREKLATEQERSQQYSQVNSTLLDQVTRLRQHLSNLARSPPSAPNSPFASMVQLSTSPDSVVHPSTGAMSTPRGARRGAPGVSGVLSPISMSASFAPTTPAPRGSASLPQPASMHSRLSSGGYASRVSRNSPHVPHHKAAGAGVTFARSHDSAGAGGGSDVARSRGAAASGANANGDGSGAGSGGAAGVSHVSTPSPSPRSPAHPGARPAGPSMLENLPGLEDDAPETLSTALRSTRSALSKALDAISKSWQGVSPPSLRTGQPGAALAAGARSTGPGVTHRPAGGDILPPDVLQSTLRSSQLSGGGR